MKHVLCWILCLTLVLGCCPAWAEEPAAPAEETVHQLERKTMPMYFSSVGLVNSAYPVYYADGVADLPYTDLREWTEAMNGFLKFGDSKEPVYAIEYDADGDWYTLTYVPTGSVALISPRESMVLFENFDTFSAERYGALDVLSLSGFNELTGQRELFARLVDLRNERKGESKAINLGDYEIPVIFQDGQCLMPLHTVFDLFFCIQRNLICCCNNQALFIGGKTMFVMNVKDPDTGEEKLQLNQLGERYYGVPKTERSEAFAWFGFNELCMELDCFYGLKEAHSIYNFRDLMVQTDYYQRLLSPDTAEADAAVQDFINFYFDDLHSMYRENSFSTGYETDLTPERIGFSGRNDERISSIYRAAADAIIPEGRPIYQEIGNTAYLTLNNFAMEYDSDYYYGLNLDDPDCIVDTVSLVLFAHHRITRENSPIQNVVLDLSLNSGGDADAALFVISWFLGEAAVANVDTFTGAQASGIYLADTNLDREFTDDDWLTYRYQLYCLISPYSFSCANLVPWAFKSDGAVTLVGRTSGGGSCVVQSMATAWGTIYQMSGFKRLSYIKNGSFYDVDRGVEPDIVLTKLSSFYDREKLTDILNNAY